jgi:lysophospholipase L1-like esterase
LLTIFGDYYDGGRNLEVVIDLYLLTPYGIPWGGCFEVPGLRYFACDGVYTDFLHSALGSYPFASGLDPAVVRYTALGDSYSSGTGAPPYYAAVDPVICKRSISTYAYYLSGGRRFGQPPVDTPNLRACHGAVIDDLYGEQHGYVPRQLYQVRPFDRLVSITIGGNDVGFSEGLRRCILGNCVTDEIPLVTPEFLSLTQTRLTILYQNILGQMRADGVLVVASYPAVLPNPRDGADPQPTLSQCPIVNTRIDTRELEAIYDATRALHQTIQRAAAAAGPRVIFVDLLDAFRGRRICSGAATTYGRDIELANLAESVHPTALGYAEMGRLIRQSAGLF